MSGTAANQVKMKLNGSGSYNSKKKLNYVNSYVIKLQAHNNMLQ